MSYVLSTLKQTVGLAYWWEEEALKHDANPKSYRILTRRQLVVLAPPHDHCSCQGFLSLEGGRALEQALEYRYPKRLVYEALTVAAHHLMQCARPGTCTCIDFARQEDHARMYFRHLRPVWQNGLSWQERLGEHIVH